MTDRIKDIFCPKCNTDLDITIECEHEIKLRLLEKQLAVAVKYMKSVSAGQFTEKEIILNSTMTLIELSKIEKGR